MLAAMRCLNDAGYEVTATASTRLAPGLWSRACSMRSILPDASRGVDGFVARMRALLQAARHDVLVPGTDATLYAVSLHRDRLAPYARLGLPEHEVVEDALSKTCLARHAEAAGLTTPDSAVCESSDAALDAARALGFPVLVKPISALSFRDGTLVRHASRLARDEGAVRHLQGQLGRCIVQRQEPGSVMSFAGVATDEGMLAAVVSRYRRTWPPEAGNACFSETIPVPRSLADHVGALVAAIGWRGLFELELVERSDGSRQAIDFNPRAYGSLSLACSAGVALPALWCQWLLGEPLLAPTARVGARYRWEDADLRYAAWELRRGGLGRAVRVLAPQVDVTHAYFRRSDPAPLVARGLELAGIGLQRGRGRRRERILSPV